MGWGRLAGNGDMKYPLVNLSDSFSSRDAYVGLGGLLSTSAFFSGENVGFFGGLDYQINTLPL